MSAVRPYICRMLPYCRPKVWGGRMLEELFGKPLPPKTPIGESWEVADLSEGQSVIDNGALRGTSLHDAVARWGGDLVGDDAPGGAFPLLVKVLDAHDDLSVQVHPGVDDVRTRFPDEASKDECWVILHADDGGSVLHGFAQAVEPERFRQAVDTGDAVTYLSRVEVRPADVIRVPPGTVHAICKGVVLLEIQQPSDSTFRVYDYQRPGLDGKPRALHLDQALAVMDFEPHGDPRRPHTSRHIGTAEHSVLQDTPAYRIERLLLREPFGWKVDRRSVQIAFVVSGACALRAGSAGADEPPVTLETGQTAVLPASIGAIDLVPAGPSPVEVIVAGLGGAALIDT